MANAYIDDDVVGGAAYQYFVTALDGWGNESTGSSSDIAAVGIMAMTSVVPGKGNIVAASHVLQLRSAVNAVRTLAQLTQVTWSDSGSLVGVPVRAVHFRELRDRLNEALSALSMPAVGFDDPQPDVGASVRVAHVQELRGVLN